jgi:hypothetical protein
MQSKAKTVEEYLASLPEDRRSAIEALRKVIKQNLGKGFEEGMQYGMIGYYVPHSIYPAGYHCDPKQPLPFACLASQKQAISVYMHFVYTDPAAAERFVAAWKATGKKLDMGKSCVRFKRLEDAALEAIGAAVKAMPMKDYIARYEAILATSGRASARKSDKQPAATKAGAARSTAVGNATPKKKAPSKKAASKKPAVKKSRSK